MKREIFRIIETMEGDLADFYRRISTLTKLKFSEELFEFMVTQCEGHKNQISDITMDANEPVLDFESIRQLHTSLKEKLYQEILSAIDPDYCFEKMAETERIVSRMYDAIAIHYEKTAEYNLKIANTMHQLAKEEIEHEEVIKVMQKNYQVLLKRKTEETKVKESEETIEEAKPSDKEGVILKNSEIIENKENSTSPPPEEPLP
jgi:hypothetical protein